jgi:hypothetical protein
MVVKLALLSLVEHALERTREAADDSTEDEANG